MNHESPRRALMDRLLTLASEELGIEPDEVADRVPALGSIERMQLAVAVEDHFRIRLGAEDEARLVSLEEVASLIEEKLGQCVAAPGAECNARRT